MKQHVKFNLLLIAFILLGCEEITNEQNISNNNLMVIAPAQDAVLTDNNVNFIWEDLEGATGYRIQIATPNFNAPDQVIEDVSVTENTHTTTLNNGLYEYRVKGVNSAYESAYTTVGIEVTGNDFATDVVSLILPAADLNTNIATQSLQWNALSAALEYRLQVISQDNSTTILDVNLSETNYSYDFNDGAYLWKVSASNGLVSTNFSQRNLLIDQIPPNDPVLTLPLDNAITTETSIDFSWTRVSLGGSIEHDVLYLYTDAALTNLIFSGEVTSPYNTTLAVGTYYWLVKAFDAAGNESNNSPTHTLTIN
jgi:hypothetical protein